MSIDKKLSEIENFIKHYNKTNRKVSAKGVDWHLDHILKVINTVSLYTVKSNPKDYKRSFNAIRALVFTMNHIPRGKGKAPKPVNNIDTIKLEDIKSQFEKAKQITINLASLSKNHNFKHPIFGLLNLKQVNTFLNVHTQHHLKIIKDIIKYND